MDLQVIIVGIVILIAASYASTVFLRKGRAMVQPSKCDDDCGCSATGKNTKIAH